MSNTNDPAWTRPSRVADATDEDAPEVEPAASDEADAPDDTRVSDPDRGAGTEPEASAPVSTAANRALAVGVTAAEWGLLIALFFGAAGVAFVATTIFVVKGTGSAPLEDQIGRGAWEASVWIAEHDWEPRIDHFEDNETYPPHTVIGTDPSPGSNLRPGAVVRLTISRGARRIPMPNVAGVRMSQARLILGRNGLAVADVLEVYDDGAAADTVLASSPAPSAPLRVGDQVRLLVSKGPSPQTWVMPEVEGYTRQSVERLMDTMGVQSRVAARLYDPDQPPGTVLEQFPAPGRPISEGQVVRLTVNERAQTTRTSTETKLVPLDVHVPRGFAARRVVVRAVRGDWTRTVLKRYAAPGAEIRVPVFVAPGDRVTILIDDEPVWERRY